MTRFLILLATWEFPTTLAATRFFILSKTLLRPAALALISRRTGEDKGAAMGLSNSFMSLCRTLGPIWAGLAFDLGRSLPYLSGSVLMLAAFLFSLRAIRTGTVLTKAQHPATPAGESGDHAARRRQPDRP